MREPAIEVRGLVKRFPPVAQLTRYSSLKSRVVARLLAGLGRPTPAAEPWRAVLDGVDLDVPSGACVGVIGRNGCGKSSLLRVVAGIYQPDAGRVRTVGRLAAMLDLGGSFHPDLSGRENAILWGLLMGSERRLIRQRLPEIAAFAEVEEYLEAPMRVYSTGMAMRLAFAVSTHLEPDVLLIDEALSVGDLAFAKRCHQRMDALRRAGRTLLIVTHSERDLLAICDRVHVLERGHLSEALEPAAGFQRLARLLQPGPD